MSSFVRLCILYQQQELWVKITVKYERLLIHVKEKKKIYLYLWMIEVYECGLWIPNKILSSCRQHHKKHKNKSSGQAVSFYIDEEEKEHLLTEKKPEIEIVVDPPSRDHSDNEERDNKIWPPPATTPTEDAQPPNHCDIIYF